MTPIVGSIAPERDRHQVALLAYGLGVEEESAIGQADYTSIQSSATVVDGSVLFGGRDGLLYSVSAPTRRDGVSITTDR